MVQYIFYVNGLRSEKDEAVIADAARSAFATQHVFVSTLTSSVRVELAEEISVDAGIEKLAAVLAEKGYSLKLPPSRVELSSADCEAQAIPRPQTAAKPRRVPISVFISSLCAVLILAVLATFAVTSELFNRRLVDIQEDMRLEEAPDADVVIPSDGSETFPELEIIKALFDQYAIEDIDQEALMTALLKAYASSTGDIYAEYYTAEELKALNADNQGEMDGIGVSVVNDKIEISGFTYSVLHIISVFEDSPALEAGLRVGDCIYTVTDAEGQTHMVDTLGYDSAVSCVRGVAGTQAEFSVLRFDSTGNYEVIPFSITRAPITSESVRGRVLESDPSIGVVKISQFDLTTPTQFQAAMDNLIQQGCTKFIFDVRYNPGGALLSIEAVLSTLLEEGDLIISTVYKDGSEEHEYVRVVDYSRYEGYDSCSVGPEDIGKYRGYEFVVLTNEYTASAAELFTSNLRDYELATLVGVKTYGKGCMQTTFDLSYFDMEGALKLTTAWYEPPSGENYHGIGITPDIEIVLDEALIEQYGNVYLIPDDADPQLLGAIEALK